MGTIALEDQIDILMEYGRDELGLPVTYRAMAAAMDESTNNLLRLRRGANQNPSLATLTSIANYFRTDLGYFSCKTEEECRAYLTKSVPQQQREEFVELVAGLPPKELRLITEIVRGLRAFSPEALKRVAEMIKLIGQGDK
jgi:transcriptional regulator with XRE-family HTH domain